MQLDVLIRHRFSSFQLDVAFTAPPGVTMLFGRSGSGKSSVVQAIAGLLRPQAGHIQLDQTCLYSSDAKLWVPPHHRRMGYVFQDARLFPHLSVRANLSYGQRFAGRGAGPHFDDMVDLLKLEPLLDRRPYGLSGGEKQRVAIGRALLANPQMLLADEPLASLDAAHGEDILCYFERLRDQLGIPIVYVSHSVTEVARLATTLVAMEAGRVLRYGPVEAVMSDPAVLPLGLAAAGALVTARLVQQRDDGLSVLETEDGLQLLVPQVKRPLGERVRLQIAAQDVMLATSKPQGISALNVLEARIVQLHDGKGPGVMVVLEAGTTRLMARITKHSALRLQLAPGQSVFAILKAVSVAKPHV